MISDLKKRCYMKFSNFAEEYSYADLKEEKFSYHSTSSSNDQLLSLQTRIQELEKELNRQRSAPLEVHYILGRNDYDFNTESLH